ACARSSVPCAAGHRVHHDRAGATARGCGLTSGSGLTGPPARADKVIWPASLLFGSYRGEGSHPLTPPPCRTLREVILHPVPKLHSAVSAEDLQRRISRVRLPVAVHDPDH